MIITTKKEVTKSGNMCVCFTHVSVSDLYIPTICLPILAAGKYVDRFWEYVNRSQTHECGNWDWRSAIPFLGIYKMGFSLQCGWKSSLGMEPIPGTVKKRVLEETQLHI
jgi:hypothetical protein